MRHIHRAITFVVLALLLSPVILVLIENQIQIFTSWQRHPQVMFASLRYHLIAWILGLVAWIVLVKTAPILFDWLSRFERRYVVFGGFFVSLALSVILCSQAQNIVLNCERARDTCVLNRQGFWWSKGEELALNTLQGAYVRINRNGDSISEQVVIVTLDGEIPMMHISSIMGGRTETVEKINAFVLDSTRPSLQISVDNRSNVLIVAILIPIVSIVFLYLFAARP